MSVRLNSWLEDTFATQLLLGQFWLEQGLIQKERGIVRESEQAWKELYRDNGSCLDIINTVDPDQNIYLRVAQACIPHHRASSCRLTI